jgi:glycine oxidase
MEKIILKKNTDILIVGAGIIGLSLALELHARGAQVTVFEQDTALAHASTAAAGMLASEDPHNPPALHPLSHLSTSLYPGFLDRIEKLSGLSVPFQTSVTHQYLDDGSATTLDEHSIDPRQLAAALIAAVRATSINLRENTVFTSGEHLPANNTIYTTGAWASSHQYATIKLPIKPAKGQMLRVQLPTGFPLHEVHRSEHVYIVPRTQGPQAGTALIGATVEDAGFDTTTNIADLDALRAAAAKLLPQFASPTTASMVEAWAGLRPATPDQLPLLGHLGETSDFIATGHFRNGILLAPATAVVLADLIESKTPTVGLAPFDPTRFSSTIER